ncbi:MAG: hypothetical protein GY869_07975, partial [Planctomycetes bacterium]|nr:hypothetical protein [Planctomycetota bacterium]
NSIVYYNIAPEGPNYFSDGPDTIFTHSCLTPGSTGIGNISDLPKFVNTNSLNYHLAATSPCINAGDNSRVDENSDLDGNARIIGGTVDMGAYEFGQTPVNSSVLTVKAENSPADVPIIVSTVDLNGDSNGWTAFARTYTNATSVTLTAPDSIGGSNFDHWKLDDYAQGSSRELQIDVNADQTAKAVYITSGQFPDLRISGYSVQSPTVTEFDSFWAECVVANSGAANAVSNHMQLFLSTDGDLDTSDDFLVEQKQVSSLMNGDEQTLRFDFSMPDLGVGSYDVWLVMQLDCFGIVQEADEDNLFVSSPAAFNASDRPGPVFNLIIQSENPTGGVNISISPNDINGAGNGATPCTRVYDSGASVTLAAPDSADGSLFSSWTLDGVNQGSSTVLQVTISANHIARAVYGSTCGETIFNTRIWGSTSDERGTDMSFDLEGNIYVAGDTMGEFDGQSSVRKRDICLSKFNADCQKQWSRIWGSTSTDYGCGGGADNAGNVYVTGWTDAAFDQQPYVANNDAYLTKHNTAGDKQWTRIWGSGYYDTGWDVCADNAGNVYVAGYTAGSFHGENNAGKKDAFLIKFDNQGSNLWTKLWGSTESEQAYTICIDNSGNIYVAGDTKGEFDGQTSVGEFDVFLTKFNPDGQKQWSRIWGSDDHDYGRGVSADSAGNVYVAGYTKGEFDGQSDCGKIDIYLTKFTSAGVKIWTRIWGSQDNDYGSDVYVDGDDNIHVSAMSKDSFDGQNAISPPGSDLSLSSFDS